jgi:hypothetical protein
MRNAFCRNLLMLLYKTSLPVQNHLHVVPDVWVPVLVEGEARRGVEQLQVKNPDLEKENPTSNVVVAVILSRKYRNSYVTLNFSISGRSRRT